MAKHLPRLLITGASGFIGRHLIEALKEDFMVCGLSRRAPKNAALMRHPNIRWIEADIGDRSMLWESMQTLRDSGGVDFVIHLAGFYDFAYDENPEYHRTNVAGTEFVLEQARLLNIKRFIFASSVAACMFPRPDGPVTESTPADATFAYARSKRKGEELVRASSRYFPCTVVRFAAVFSDWCEYGPLYMFISTWLTRSWKSRILGGKGKSAITYIHINDIIEVLLTVMRRADDLPPYHVCIASPDKPVSHEELYELSTRFFFGKRRNPFHMPKPIAWLGVLTMDLFGRAVGSRPFERPWMMRYVDKQLAIDASNTRNALHWSPSARYPLQRRLLFMIERMKSYPLEWQRRNIRALKRIPAGPNFRIYEALDLVRENVVQKVVDHVLREEHHEEFATYRRMDPLRFSQDVTMVYQVLCVSVRTKDRMSLLEYARQVAQARCREGFPFAEVRRVIETIGKTIEEELASRLELKGMEQEVYDEITLTFQLVADESETAYEERGKV